MKRIEWVFLVALPLAVLLAGCEGLPIFQACTDAGCSDFLRVELVGELPEEFTLRVEVPGLEPRIRECSVSSPCESTVFFEDFTPERVKLVFLSETGSKEMTVSPSYSVVRPNGESCPPKCRQGVVEFPIS